MDIARLSMDMAQTKTYSSVNIAMMKKAIEQTEQVGENLVRMMQQAAVTPPGSTVDLRG